MAATVCYVHEIEKAIVTKDNQELYYCGSFADGNQDRILVFMLHTRLFEVHSNRDRTIYVNIGKNCTFPLTLNLLGVDVIIVKQYNSESGGLWAGLEVRLTNAT